MLRWLLMCACLWVPGASLAGSVYLNGVSIDGVVNKQFTNCTVRIDARGNVHIITGKPQSQSAPSPAKEKPVAGPPTRKYYLVTEKAVPGMTQYDIDVFVNAKWVRKFLDIEEHVVLEITKYLKTGPNKLVFLAKKDMGGNRRSTSPQHYFRIVVGEGEATGRTVMISRKLIDYKRTALETKGFRDEFVIQVR